jgi:hypothetical protein
MKNSRLFTFGCSFTKYKWPTWADIIGTNYYKHYNLGHYGAGNYYIAEKLYETHTTTPIKSDDVVIIMLSSANRLDIYDPSIGKFNLNGNIYNSEHIFGEKFVREVWNDTHSIYNTWFMVKTMKTLLESIGCNYKIIEAFGLHYTDDGRRIPIHSDIQFLLDNYKEYVYTDAPLHIFSRSYSPSTYKLSDGSLDGHPTIMCNHDFVKHHLSEFYDSRMEDISKIWESEVITDDIASTIFSVKKIKKIVG